MGRRDASVLGGPSTWSTIERMTVICPLSKSTSCHFNPNNSPRRRPVTYAAYTIARNGSRNSESSAATSTRSQHFVLYDGHSTLPSESRRIGGCPLIAHCVLIQDGKHTLCLCLRSGCEFHISQPSFDLYRLDLREPIRAPDRQNDVFYLVLVTSRVRCDFPLSAVSSVCM